MTIENENGKSEGYYGLTILAFFILLSIALSNIAVRIMRKMTIENEKVTATMASPFSPSSSLFPLRWEL